MKWTTKGLFRLLISGVLSLAVLAGCGGGGGGTTTSAPTGVSASAGDGQVAISWSASSGATSYNIYWSTTTGVTKTNGTKISSATSPYSHTGRTNGTTYYYIVTAVNSSGESVESAQVSGTPAAATATNYAGTYSGTLTVNSANSGTFSVTVDSSGAINGSINFNDLTNTTLSGQVTTSGIVTFTLIGKTDTYSGTIDAAIGAFAASCTSGCVDSVTFTGTKQTTVGTAFPIANTSGREMSWGAAFDGTNFLVGIEGDATPPNSITAQLVSKTGTLVGPRISTGGTGGAPIVAFDGTNYLLAWEEDALVWEGAATVSTKIFGQLVSTSGALVGSQFTIATGTDMRAFGLIFDGTNYFIAWENRSTGVSPSTSDVFGQFITTSGATLGSVVSISTAAYTQRELSIAFDGANILAVWVDGRNQSACEPLVPPNTTSTCYESDIYGQFITKSGASAAGTLSGGNFLINAGTLPRDNPTGIAFDGTNYLVTFMEETTFPNACPSSGCNWEAYGILVSKTGSTSGSKFVIGNTTTSGKFFPQPTYIGTKYLVTWTDGWGTTSASVKGQYITTSGAVEGSEFTLFSPSSTGAVLWLGKVFTGGGVNLAVTNWGIPDATEPWNMDLYTSADVMGSIITIP